MISQAAQLNPTSAQCKGQSTTNFRYREEENSGYMPQEPRSAVRLHISGAWIRATTRAALKSTKNSVDGLESLAASALCVRIELH